MVKSKKMSKTGIAVIVLALLLVLSMVMGLTGAWFTSSKSDLANKVVTFGQVQINATAMAQNVANKTAEVSGADIMPGDTLIVESTITNTYEKSYVRFTVSVSTNATGSDLATLDFDAANCLLGSVALVRGVHSDTPAANDDNHFYAAMAKEDTTGKLLSLKVVLAGDSFGDSYQGKTITISLVVDAIQQANLSGHASIGTIGNEGPSAEQYAKIFAELGTAGVVTHPVQP